MRKVIHQKLYDTDTAEELFHWDNGRYAGDFKARAKTLFRTEKGSFFLLHEGGPLTDVAVPNGNGLSGSTDIEPISEEDVIGFLETHGGTRLLLDLFPDKIESA